MTDRRPNVRLRQIEVFAGVFEAASFSKAAEALGLAQPTISTHVRTLEEELETKLFHRRGRTVTPTAAGVKLYAHARRILELKDAAVSAVVGEDGQGLRGEVQVGASNIPGTYLLPAIVGRFRARHPLAQVRLDVRDSEQVLCSVRDGIVEVGFVGTEPDATRFDARRLCEDRIVLVALPSHPLAGQTVASSALKGQPFVVRRAGSGTLSAAAGALAKLGVEIGVDCDVALEVSSNEGAREAVRAGVGISFVSRFSVRGELERGELATIQVRRLSLRRSFFVVTSKRRVPGALVEAFLECARVPA